MEEQEFQGFVEPYESRIARYRAANKPRRMKRYPIEPKKASNPAPKAATKPAPPPKAE